MAVSEAAAASDGRPPSSPAPRCSIVIPVHGRSALTRACLDALLDQRLDATEILVADDGSTDSTPELLRSYGDAIRVVEPEMRRGFGGACNAAAARSAGRYLILLNNDTLPAEGWLDALVDDAERHPRAAIVGAKLLWPNNTVQHAGIVFDRGGNARHIYAGLPSEHPAVNRSRPFQAVTAAAMLIRREVFEELGGFDAAFVNGWEDMDLCLRAGERGHEVRCCHESVLYHLEGATRGYDYEADHPNWRIYRERWADRVRADDLEHYVADGLVEVEHGSEGVRLSVSPQLGTAATAGGPNALEHALRERTAECLELMRENLRLTLERDAPRGALAARPAERPALPASGLADLTVIVAAGDDTRLARSLPVLLRQGEELEGFELLLAGGAPGSLPREASVRHVEADPASGRAGALNAGVEAASGELVLLLADDFMPRPGFLAEHLAAHRQHPREHVAALGPALFPAAARSDRFAAWLEDSGELFGLSFTRCGETLGRRFFWAGNVSLKRDFLLAGQLFDERLSDAAWDDHELGIRLFDRGLQVVYAPRAAATNERQPGFAEQLEVLRRSGAAAATFDSIYPPPHPCHSGTDPSVPITALSLSAQAARARYLLRRRQQDREEHWRLSLRRAFIEGYRARAWR